MSPFRYLVSAALALAVAPASAVAQTPEPEGSGDNYFAPVLVSTNTAPRRLSPSVIGYDVDTTNYTTENGAPIFGGGPEFNQCGNSAYGKTVWSVFYTDRYGRIDITAAGFDAVIRLVSFKDPNNPTPTEGPCTDRLFGNIESFPRSNLPTVKKNHWYAIQVGGARQPDGTFVGGPLEVNAELMSPNSLSADADLSSVPANRGIKVKSVKVEGAPSGSVVTVRCLKKSCGRSQSVSIERAGTKRFFKGRKIRNGTRLRVDVQAEEQIGEVIYWDVKSNAAGQGKTGCTEPGASTPRALYSCDGK